MRLHSLPCLQVVNNARCCELVLVFDSAVLYLSFYKVKHFVNLNKSYLNCPRRPCLCRSCFEFNVFECLHVNIAGNKHILLFHLYLKWNTEAFVMSCRMWLWKWKYRCYVCVCVCGRRKVPTVHFNVTFNILLLKNPLTPTSALYRHAAYWYNVHLLNPTSMIWQQHTSKYIWQIKKYNKAEIQCCRAVSVQLKLWCWIWSKAENQQRTVGSMMQL